MATVNFINGYWFYFQDGDTDIAVHGSAWSGRETVYVNDNPVSSKRELLKFTSDHYFTHNAHEYQVRYHLKNVLTGSLECEVYRDGKLLASQTKGFVKQGKKAWQMMLLLFLIGFGVGSGVIMLAKLIAG